MADEFTHWLPLRSLSVKDFLRHGEFPAVYALRDSATGDILKYGKTTCLRTRIIGNFLGGIGGDTTRRIHKELFSNNMIDRVELAWIETKNGKEAGYKESKFREAYKQTNGRRPKWDLNG